MTSGKNLFLPQKVYLSPCNLAKCIAYQEKPKEAEHIRQLLKEVGLICPHHEEQLQHALKIGNDYLLFQETNNNDS